MHIPTPFLISLFCFYLGSTLGGARGSLLALPSGTNHPGSAQGTPWDAGNQSNPGHSARGQCPPHCDLPPACPFLFFKALPRGARGPGPYPQPESSSTRLPQAASRSFQKLPRAPFQFLSFLFFNFFGGKEKSLHRASRRCLLCSRRSVASGLRTGPSPRLGQMPPEVGSLSFPPPSYGSVEGPGGGDRLGGGCCSRASK